MPLGRSTMKGETMRSLKAIVTFLVVLECVLPVSAQEAIHFDARRAFDRQIAEVRRARELETIDVRRHEGYDEVLRAAREGLPYERFAAIRVLGRIPESAAVLQQLSVGFRGTHDTPRLADFCEALVIASAADGASLEEVEAVYLPHLQDHNPDTPLLSGMLLRLYLEQSQGDPSEKLLRAGGIIRPKDASNLSPCNYYRLKRYDGNIDDHVSRLIATLEAGVLPKASRDPSFPSCVQAAVAALIDAGEPAMTALLERYGDIVQPKSDREYLILLHVVDVFQGSAEVRAIPFLRGLEKAGQLGPDAYKFTATAGYHNLHWAALTAEEWIRSGVRYPYHDWLAGWYRWFVIHE